MNLLMVGMAVTLTITAASGASAQMFTFESQNDAPATVGGVGADGAPFGGAYWTGKSNATFADGRKTTSTTKCISMSQPPRDSIFMMHGACDIVSNDGTFSALMGCNFVDKAGTETSCVGGLVGKTGAYAGRRGTLTVHGKGAAAKGTGQWLQ